MCCRPDGREERPVTDFLDWQSAACPLSALLFSRTLSYVLSGFPFSRSLACALFLYFSVPNLIPTNLILFFFSTPHCHERCSVHKRAPQNAERRTIYKQWCLCPARAATIPAQPDFQEGEIHIIMYQEGYHHKTTGVFRSIPFQSIQIFYRQNY